MRKIAIDAGCAYIKVAMFDDMNRVVTHSIPSIVSDEKPLVGLDGSESASYLCEGRQWSINPLSTRACDTRFPEYPYSSLNTVLMHHGLLKSGVRDPEIQLSTCIPLDDYYSDNRTARDRKRAAVQRQVTSVLGDSLPRISHRLTLPEGLAGWIDMCFDRDGKPKPGLPTGEIGLVDIGGRTTDLAVVQGTTNIYRDTIRTLDFGYLRVFGQLNELLASQFGSGKFSPAVLDNALRTRQIEVESGHIEDIGKLVDQVIHAFADGLMHEINTIMGNRGQLSGTCYFGGGVEHIRDVIGKPKVFIPKNPQYSNVIGCLKAFRADLG